MKDTVKTLEVTVHSNTEDSDLITFLTAALDSNGLQHH